MCKSSGKSGGCLLPALPAPFTSHPTVSAREQTVRLCSSLFSCYQGEVKRHPSPLAAPPLPSPLAGFSSRPVMPVPAPQDSGLAELAHRLQDLSPSPPSHELQRWLVAHNTMVGEAETAYRDSLAWRQQRGINLLLKWQPPEVLRHYYPGGFAGFDPCGCPVWIVPFGRADMKGLLACVSKEEFIDFTLRIIESSLALMRQQTRDSGEAVTQHVFIFDLDGFSLTTATHRPTLDILQRLIAVYEANYPETLKAAYVLNASPVFQLVFRIVKSAVEQKTLGKIQVFGSGGWREVLDVTLGPYLLPPPWGEGEEREGICLAGEVPEHYRAIATPRDLPGVGEVTTATVAAGAVLTLRYTFGQDTVLQWKYRTEGGDIGHSVTRKRARRTLFRREKVSQFLLPSPQAGASEQEKSCQPGIPDIQISQEQQDETDTGGICDLQLTEEVEEEGSYEEDPSAAGQDVVPMARVKSHKELQTVCFPCKAGFTYLLNFDNTHSVFRSKRLLYGVKQQVAETPAVEAVSSPHSMEELVRCVRQILTLEEGGQKRGGRGASLQSGKTAIMSTAMPFPSSGDEISNAEY